ncbi:MAG: ABC transporter ATP-binding protein [Lentimicrobiaceae bacterium]|jgi:ABC-2 type transport system ATP-binding protein|nr:ABC transporter ATP-binding protein [Lentimicrobiaceae bacterium]
MSNSNRHTHNSEIVLQTEKLVKIYRRSDEQTLKGVDLSISKQEFFGLLGPNGAGKTTLISIICGLLKITSGTVNVQGIDVKKHPEKIKNIIGLVPQELALYPTLTLRENLSYFASMHGLSGSVLNKRVEELISMVMLDSHANKWVSRCSGGIKRRANLITGLVHNPSILFLDEPTLGVDAQSRNLIFEYLQQLNSSGTTIFYTTHYMQEAENLCSRVNIIDNGQIIENGTPAQLIEKNPSCGNLGDVFLKLTGKDLRD